MADCAAMVDGLRSDEDGRCPGLTTGALPKLVAGKNYPPGLWEQARPALRQDDLSERTIPPCWILEASRLDYNQFRAVGRAERTVSPSRNPRLGDRCPPGGGPQGTKRNIMLRILAA